MVTASLAQGADPEIRDGVLMPVRSPSPGNLASPVARAATLAAIYPRLRLGKPTWLDQLSFRLPGLALLAGCWRLMTLILARAAVNHAPPQDTAELVLPMVAVLCLLGGLLLCVLGPGLLQEVPWPAMSRYRPQAARPQW
jgi:hypothetical protein